MALSDIHSECASRDQHSAGQQHSGGEAGGRDYAVGPSNWTSWPPHEHAKKLEEIYIFVDMPMWRFLVRP
jgi:hypothetical protein